jgi:hypothetical protein
LAAQENKRGLVLVIPKQPLILGRRFVGQPLFPAILRWSSARRMTA